ncbi:phage major capsid protein [Candidatus Pacearchaeota archaeon]|nr:phage major capsid protein [Candidatus Pacearchaeota archaeon]
MQRNWPFFIAQKKGAKKMLTVAELKERAVTEAEAAREIKDKADQESRGMTEDEAEQFDAHLKESERMEKESDRQERLEATEKRLNEPEKRKVTPETANGDRIETSKSDMFKFGQLRAFTGKAASADAYLSGKWLMATVMDDAASRQWCRDKGIDLRVQTEGVNTAGGFVVPDVMERAIIDLRETYGMYRANARVLPMASDHTVVPRRTGGVTAYFIGETTEITESEKSWNQVELTAKKLGALTRMSTDLNEDAIINIADDLAQEMAWAFAKKEDQCGLDGDGTNTYGGMVGIRAKMVDGNHAGSYDAGTSPCTAWSHITIADEITTVMSKLPTYALPRAKWYIHPAGKAACFDALALAAGGNTTREIAAGAQPMFGGYPVVVSAAMPSAPTNGTICILFGDLSMAATFGNRRGITVKVSGDRYLEYDQIGIQATERFCIVNHDVGDSSDAGPVVGLQGTT